MLQREDTFITKGKRRQLAEKLKQAGIRNIAVLDAINSVPRHFFVDEDMQHLAYDNKPLSIGNRQTISQPFTVAFQTQLLELKPTDKVLEIGTGSGYQAAIIAHIGAEIYSVERIKNLFDKTQKLFAELNYNVKLFYGDGYAGLPDYAPFDKIIITAAIPEIPKTLLNQLSVNGRLVAPLGKVHNHQVMVRITRTPDNKFVKESFGNFVFVPMLKGTE